LLSTYDRNRSAAVVGEALSFTNRRILAGSTTPPDQLPTSSHPSSMALTSVRERIVQ
jgi:hypothetical protein